MGPADTADKEEIQAAARRAQDRHVDQIEPERERTEPGQAASTEGLLDAWRHRHDSDEEHPGDWLPGNDEKGSREQDERRRPRERPSPLSLVDAPCIAEYHSEQEI